MGQLTVHLSLPFYPCKLGEGGSLAAWGWEAASSGAPAGSGSVPMGSSALSLFLLASWSWCRRATSAFRFSRSFWLSRRIGVRVGVRGGPGPPSPHWLCLKLNLGQNQTQLCSERDRRETSASLPSPEQKGPEVLKSKELHAPVRALSKAWLPLSLTPSSNLLQLWRLPQEITPRKRVGRVCRTQKVHY